MCFGRLAVAIKQFFFYELRGMKTSDKIKLAERIRSIEGLNDEERSALLGLELFGNRFGVCVSIEGNRVQAIPWAFMD